MKQLSFSKLATALLFFLLVTTLAIGQSASSITVSVVTDSAPGLAVKHGLNKLIAALKAKGVSVEQATRLDEARGDVLLVAGRAAGDGAASELHGTLKIAAPEGAESLLIRHTQWKGRKALLVSGADDRGLMYGLLDMANRIGWAADAKNLLSEVRDANEKPYSPERALSIYTMQKAHFESRFFDEKYWARYFDVLAENRFNSFVLIFGYENAGYFAPAYPYFFNVEGFPEVQVTGLTKEQQRRNLEALNRLIKMAHDRGLNFTAGLWDHIYRGGVQSGGVREAQSDKPRPDVVTGLTEKTLMAYHRAALAKFLKLVPDLDAVQFRMHGESGLKKEEMHEFWKNIYQVMKEHAPNVRFDARVKDFPDSLIDLALEMGVKIRLTTKYWAEQMGLPFHPTHINRQNQFDRRHGYADLLRYAQRYKMHWRLWSGGTTRVLLWGDPEYVRRFAESTRLYDGDGFEVNEPLATKMASHPHEMKPFDLLRPQYRYYDHEFERYWHFFQVFGRIGYNPGTPPEVWRKEFERRFGKEAAPFVEQALHSASWVLPMAQAYNFPYNRFPTTRGWVEKQRREDLPVYARAEPSDTQQFLSINEAASNLVAGKESAMRHPLETSKWFAGLADDVLRLVDQAEKHAGANKSKEFISTTVDLKILANLARYHSRRIYAGISYALFKQSQDLNVLDDAIAHEGRAIEAWEKIVEAAGDAYNDNLMMGLPASGLAGHWKDELAELRRGLKELQQERERFRPAGAQGEPLIAHAPVRKLAPGEDLIIRATVSSQNPITSVRVAYRSPQGDYRYASMQQSGPLLYRAVVPGANLVAGLSYFIEAVDQAGRQATYPSKGQAESIILLITSDNEPPVVIHKPVTSALSERPLTITAEARDPSGIKWVRLRYRSVNQHQDYQTLTMMPTDKKDQYQATVPAAQIVPKWDFMYLIEVMDNQGNGAIYPELKKETPYIVVKLERREIQNREEKGSN
jgi:hypothetical protein